MGRQRPSRSSTSSATVSQSATSLSTASRMIIRNHSSWPIQAGDKLDRAGDELRALKRYLALREDSLPWLFVSERGQPLTRQTVNYLVGSAADRAGLPWVHPHMLRHSCGFALAKKGYDLRLIQDYLGHRDPRHTAHYTRTAGNPFEGL